MMNCITLCGHIDSINDDGSILLDHFHDCMFSIRVTFPDGNYYDAKAGDLVVAVGELAMDINGFYIEAINIRKQEWK